jgi:two-component system sensor histidine kinase YesM
MLDQLEESYKTRERDALEKNVLEIRLLQSQMNPHLLYNTLNSVALAIKHNDSEKAEQLIFTLSNFFRLSLSKGSAKIALETELEIIRNYIHIQNLARHKSIVLREEIPENFKTYKMLCMTILPIVENSVIHGLSGYRDDGEIIVRCNIEYQTNTLIITVRDNGVGIEENELKELNQNIDIKNRAKDQKSFGLYNVNWRIKNEFGMHYGISISSEISDYTEVRIALPNEQEGG